MSVGPAALGTVLVQRLDAVMGTTMAAHANLISGARPDAVSQPGAPERPGQTDSATRDPRQTVQAGGARGDRQNTVVDAKTAAALALAARGLVTSNDTTASAPTTLGSTARSIMALLAQYPDAAPPVAGRAPLWQASGTIQTDGAAQPPSASAANTQPGQGQPAQTATPAPSATLPLPGTANSAATGATTNVAAGAGATAPQSAAPHGPNAVTMTAFAPQAPQAAQLAQALRQALQSSGLFYESHLTELVFGKRTAAQLENEPQARLKDDAAASSSAAATARKAGAEPTATRAASMTGADAPSSTTSPANTHAPGTPVAGIHQDTSLLVRQQLDVLANQALAWQGEAWPGTPMEWEVERDPYGGDPDSATPTWATRLKLDLPRLGLVEVRLNLAGDQVVMQLIAPLSASEIRASSDQLRTRLSDTGLTLSNLSVDAVDPQAFVPPEF